MFKLALGAAALWFLFGRSARPSSSSAPEPSPTRVHSTVQGGAEVPEDRETVEEVDR